MWQGPPCLAPTPAPRRRPQVSRPDLKETSERWDKLYDVDKKCEMFLGELRAGTEDDETLKNEGLISSDASEGVMPSYSAPRHCWVEGLHWCGNHVGIKSQGTRGVRRVFCWLACCCRALVHATP